MRSQFLRPGVALVLSAAFLLGSGAVAFSQTATAQVPKTADTAALPAAKEIIERHVKAVGGREALAARKSVKSTGTISIPATGMTGTVEAFAARPNKMLMRQNIEGIGEALEAFDGTNGWSINPMTGPTLTTGDELKQRALDAEFDNVLNAASRYTSMKTLEKTTFDGREVYKVSLVRTDGVEDIEYYDVKTGLKAGGTMTRKTPMGEITVTQTLQDYKKFDGLLTPTVLKQTAMGVEMIINFTTVEYDAVDPKVFEAPAAIKALLEKK